MATIQPQYIAEGDVIDFAPVAAAAAGTVLQIGTVRLGQMADEYTADDLAANRKTSLRVNGIIEASHTGGAIGVDGQLGFNFTTQHFIDYVSGPSCRVNEDTGRTDSSSNPILRASMNVG